MTQDPNPNEKLPELPNLDKIADMPSPPLSQFERNLLKFILLCIVLTFLFGKIDPWYIIEDIRPTSREYPPWDKYKYFKNQPNNIYCENNLRNNEYRTLCYNFYQLDSNDLVHNLGITTKNQKLWKKMFFDFRSISNVDLGPAYEFWRFVTFKKPKKIQHFLFKSFLDCGIDLPGIMYINRRDVGLYELFRYLHNSRKLPTGETQLESFLFIAQKSGPNYGKFSELVNKLHPGMLKNLESKFKPTVIERAVGVQFLKHNKGVKKVGELHSKLKLRTLYVKIAMYNTISNSALTTEDWQYFNAYGEEFVIYCLLLARKYPRTGSA